MMFSCRSSLSAFLPPPPVAVATFCPARGYAVAASSVANPISTVSKRVVSLSGAMSADGTIDNIMDTAAITSSTPTTSFEAILPDPAVVMGMGFVVLLCIAASYVWGNEVVPVSRTKLAISKSRGEVREYLDGLRKSNETIVHIDDDYERIASPSASDEYTTTISIATNKVDSPEPPTNPTDTEDGRDFERWLFSDWLNKPTSAKGGRQKEPALPILREAKWNSGDNPVLVTAAIMMLGVILASITERIAT